MDELNLLVHLTKIEENKQPGGVWVRVCDKDRLLLESGFTSAEAFMTAEGDKLPALMEGAVHFGDRGRTIWFYVYSGEGGDMVGLQIYSLAPVQVLRRQDPRAATAYQN